MPIIVFLECRPSKKCDQSARTNARFPNYYVFYFPKSSCVFFPFFSEKWFSHIGGMPFLVDMAIHNLYTNLGGVTSCNQKQ